MGPVTPPARTLLLVAVGGAVGATSRYALVEAFPAGAAAFPTTTLLVNVGGAFLLGLLVETIVGHERHTHWARPLLGIGALGAFTTFSTLASQTVLLVRDGRGATAVAYVATTIVLGVAAAASGLLAGGWRPAAPVPDEGES